MTSRTLSLVVIAAVAAIGIGVGVYFSESLVKRRCLDQGAHWSTEDRRCESVLKAKASGAEVVLLADDRPLFPAAMTDEELATLRQRADELAKASRLTVLDDGAPDELRLWISWATFDPDTLGYGTGGFILSGDTVRACEITYPKRDHTPSGGRCQIIEPARKAIGTLPSLATLVPFAGLHLQCGMMDGEWAIIDFVHAGKRYLLDTSNPLSCTDPGSHIVSRFLNAVRQ